MNNKWNRRELLAGVAGAGMLGCSGPQAGKEEKQQAAGECLDISQYQPKSMLHVPETKVPKPRFPVVDYHTHLTLWKNPTEGSGEISVRMPPEEVLKIMDRKGIQMMVNLTGGSGKALQAAIDTFQKPYPDRFSVFIEPLYGKVNDPNYSKLQADTIEEGHKMGARGLKLLKSLGLVLREGGTTGPLIKVDDPRFDSMWEAAGAFHMPVTIHTSDPEAFFLPIDRFNERYEELHAHPDWSFHGKDYPSNMELQEARFRVVARHPKTTFVFAHVGNVENLAYIGEGMDKHPNVCVDIAARIGGLGRQPRMARKFFEKYQDRILFGTDAVPYGKSTPQQYFCDELYDIYYRFLESEDEYFDYAPAPTPPQGRWEIYGLGLPEGILRKIYYTNAERLLGMKFKV